MRTSSGEMSRWRLLVSGRYFPFRAKSGNRETFIFEVLESARSQSFGV